MKLTIDDLFPGLSVQISPARKQRVEQSLNGLFTKTLTYLQDGSPFIITGDIPAMWLRDSTWQVAPLLKSNHPEIIELLIAISKVQIKLFLIDPFANAFNPGPTGECWHKDFPDQSPWVFERKYELDSWAALLYLARVIEERYGRDDHLDSTFLEALNLMMRLAKAEQRHDFASYRFLRDNGVAHDSLSHDGYGAPVGYTGMIFSAFRPSDDACQFGYLVPSNLFFHSELSKLNERFKSDESRQLAHEIIEGVNRFAISDGRYAYEVDGLGNSLFIDDANIPSLLSLPIVSTISTDDEIYQATRSSILSETNPYFFTGEKAVGIGSQHTPKNHIWPISLAVQAITDTSLENRLAMLELLESTDAGTGFMHESFDVDDDYKFTRSWFSWADMTYVALVLSSVNYS